MEAATGRNSGVSAEELRALELEVRDLKRRVLALELGQPKPETPLAPEPLPLEGLKVSSDAIPMAGFAFLGIAGAYLLRALAELGALPRGVGVAAGIAYAAAWLWLAARTDAARRFAVAARVATSVLIFTPLIWESAVRFQMLPAWAAAGVVIAYSIAAETVSWRKNLKTIAAVVPAACALLALALLLGTYALAPFTLALIAIGASMEFAALEDRATAARWVAAACADLAVLALAALIRRPGGLPEGYAPVPAGFAAAIAALLALVYAASAIASTLVRGRKFGVLEIGQTAGAYALGVGGIAAITGAKLPVSVFVLATGLACYAIAARIPEGRNRSAYATFGLLLIASAAWLALPGAGAAIACSALAVMASLWNVDRAGGAHAAALLWLAMMGSGVVSASAGQFFGSGGEFPAAYAAVILLAGAIAYFAARQRGAALLIAAALAWMAAGWLASLLRFPAAPTIALICASAGLAWAGAAWRRRELVWLMYAFMAAAGLRILLRDLPSAAKIELVAPLLVFGAALILLPRILARARS